MNWFMRRRVRQHAGSFANKADIIDWEVASSVLFAVFSRYGDAVISFKVIAEVARQHPDKRFFLITAYQFIPYAERILSYDNVSVFSFNKRSLFSWCRLLIFLGKERIDLAFNPLSHGLESEFLGSCARKFVSYRLFRAEQGASVLDHFYDRIRLYIGQSTRFLGVAEVGLPECVERILICPISTESRKNLHCADVAKVIEHLRCSYPNAEFCIAIPKDFEKEFSTLKCSFFFFGKKKSKSYAFLKLIDDVDLFVGVDSGPLHICQALAKPGVAFLGYICAETLLDYDARFKIVRAAEMASIHCHNTECCSNACVKRGIRGDFLRASYEPSKNINLHQGACPLDAVVDI